MQNPTIKIYNKLSRKADWELTIPPLSLFLSELKGMNLCNGFASIVSTGENISRFKGHVHRFLSGCNLVSAKGPQELLHFFFILLSLARHIGAN
jgi:hypothetical protein